LVKDRLRSRGRNKGKLPRGKDLVNRKEVGGGDGSSKRSWGREGHMVKDRGRSIVNNGDRQLKDRGKGNLIISINGLSFSLLHTVGQSFSMSSKMLCSSSSNLRCFSRGHWCNKGSCSRSNWSSNCNSFRSHRNVCSSNSESIDVIRNIIDSLQNSIGINILVASSGHSKSILGFSLG